MKTKMLRGPLAGYLCVLGGAMSSFVNSGMFRSTTLIYEILLDKFAASKTTTAWVFGTYELVSWNFTWATTYLCKRFGCRKVVIIGGLIKSLGILLCAFPPSLAYMYFSYGVINAIGTSMTWNPIYIILSQHYQKQKARAISISTMGGSIGGIVLGPLVQFLFEKYGYFGTMLILSGISLHICVGGGLFVSPANEMDIKVLYIDKSITNNDICDGDDNKTDKHENFIPFPRNCLNGANCAEGTTCNDHETNTPTEQGSDNTSALVKIKRKVKPVWNVIKNPLVLSYAICLMFLMMAHCAASTYMAGIAEQKNITKMQSALILSVSSGADIICRPMFGVLYDFKVFRKRRSLVFVAVSMLLAMCMAVVPLINGFVPFLITWSCYMVFATGCVSQYFTVIGDLVGLDNLHHAMGFNGLFLGLGSTLGPVFGGLIRDTTGLYDLVYYCSAGVTALGSAIFLTIFTFHSCLWKY